MLVLLAQGGDCFGVFMQWGLDKGVLKSIWDVVAGNAGHLSQDQFIKCVYLMDNAKRGMPVPKQLPAGQFPPLAGTTVNDCFTLTQFSVCVLSCSLNTNSRVEYIL